MPGYSAATPRPDPRAPTSHIRRALTLVGLLIIVAVVLVSMAVCAIMLSAFREQVRRTMCNSNLKGIGIGLSSYAGMNAGMFPIVPHAPADQDGIGNVVYAPGRIGAKRTGIRGVASAPASMDDPAGGGSTIADTELSTTRNLWLLVRWHAATPRLFFCPSAPGAEVNVEDYPGQFYDFIKYTEVSYGYQVPYGQKGQPSTNMAPTMPLAADKGPFGAALEADKPNPGVPNLAPGASPDDWARWNSLNHGGEGQNVLYADGHANFELKPTIGINNDNIYTRWSGAGGEVASNEPARAHGLPPTGRETPWSDTDSLIYP